MIVKEMRGNKEISLLNFYCAMQTRFPSSGYPRSKKFEDATLANKKENVIDQNYCRSESVSPKLNRFYESFIPNEMYLTLNKVFSEY